MELDWLRITSSKRATAALVYVDDRFECYGLENPWTVAKQPGHSRIPEGRYRIRFREAESPMTLRWRERHPWFHWHIELQDVPDYQHVYIHEGNQPVNTDGCPVVGNQLNNIHRSAPFLGDSVSAFRALYAKISQALEDGEEVWINVRSIEQGPDRLAGSPH